MKDKKIKIRIMTDLHHLSKKLYDGGSAFQQVIRSTAGTLSEYSEEILLAFRDRILQSDCDVLVVPGDLTFNGEMQSLREVKAVLEGIREAGIPVLVLPGNHDIRHRRAHAYRGDRVLDTEIVTQEGFRRMMHMFGPGGAEACDEASFSYLYRIADDLSFLLLDANTEALPGAVLPETLAWAESQLEKAREDGVTVISVSHQNALCQSRYMDKGFVLHNREETVQLLKQYGVFLHLSGHSHLSGTACDGQLTDICSESISVYPLQYGAVNVAEDRKSFESSCIRLGILQEEAKARFDETIRRFVQTELGSTLTDSSEGDKLLQFACRICSAYFRGDAYSMDEEDEYAWDLWQRTAPHSFWKKYIESILH
ncbi:MAG: metallophosphoesterase [Solobacterium sp.]|nr:metallophosphoesterase [Solobacterium sp.]